MATMKAVQIHEYGGPDVLKYEDVPRPKPKSREILVRIYAASVNPIDLMMRSGDAKAMVPHLPYILGWDLAGVVEQVGAGVEGYVPGDAVYAAVGPLGGCYAEYAAIPAFVAAHKPASLDFVTAASVPLVALTAWQSLFEVAGLSAGQTVLIHGAAGAVGSKAVQFAKVKGAHVIGTASAHNADFLRELGADEVIDYNQTRFEDVVQNVDVVFDTIGGDTQQRSWGVLKKGGILASVVPPPPDEDVARAHSVRGQFVASHPSWSQLAEIARLIDAGRVKTIVDTVLPLASARRAHELGQSSQTRTKIVLQVVD